MFCASRGQTRSHLCLVLRSQPLCFAVTRIFYGLSDTPEGARRGIRRMFDTPLTSSSRPSRALALSWVKTRDLLSLSAKGPEKRSPTQPYYTGKPSESKEKKHPNGPHMRQGRLDVRWGSGSVLLLQFGSHLFQQLPDGQVLGAGGFTFAAPDAVGGPAAGSGIHAVVVIDGVVVVVEFPGRG